MYRRILSHKLSSLASQFPVIFLTGPRQSGKTTLAKSVFDAYAYVNLEDPSARAFAREDPRGFLQRYPQRAIFDEVQRAPELLSMIQVLVDEDPRPGRFILTGSQQLHLARSVSQTLAGRAALCVLLPLSVSELTGQPDPDPWKAFHGESPVSRPDIELDTLLFQGLFPRIHDRALDVRDWMGSYYATYVERDVRDLAHVGDLDLFHRFIQLCAGRSGQLLNLSSLVSDCGVSHTTARTWISTLQASFVIHLLPPHFQNFSKRLIRSPKLYFLDTGLLCNLLRIRSADDIAVHGLRGAIFETFVVSEFLKAFQHRGESAPLYFWRDRTGHEVDLLIDQGTLLLPIEVKASRTVTATLFDGLRYFTGLGSPAASEGILVHGGEEGYLRGDFAVRPWYRCV